MWWLGAIKLGSTCRVGEDVVPDDVPRHEGWRAVKECVQCEDWNLGDLSERGEKEETRTDEEQGCNGAASEQSCPSCHEPGWTGVGSDRI